MITTTLAMMMALQGANEVLAAIDNDNPETWTVEYPRLIQPYVIQYRNCLNAADRRVTGKPDFQEQHLSDIPRCKKVREEAIALSNAEMADAKTRLTEAETDLLFRNIGIIHVARGRDLDQQFTNKIESVAAAQDEYEANRPEGLVIERRPRQPVETNEEGNCRASD